MGPNINSLNSSDGRADGYNPQGQGFNPPLGQDSFSNNSKFSIIRKRILSKRRIKPLTLRVVTFRSIIRAIQAIDIMSHFIPCFICDIKMKMCSKRFFSRINEDFLQWESSRHHLSQIQGEPSIFFSTLEKKGSLKWVGAGGCAVVFPLVCESMQTASLNYTSFHNSDQYGQPSKPCGINQKLMFFRLALPLFIWPSCKCHQTWWLSYSDQKSIPMFVTIKAELLSI